MKKAGIIISLMFILFLSGCFKTKIPYIVSFDSLGGTNIDPIKTDGKSLFTIPEEPVLLGYDFVGWYFDNETFENKFEKNSFVSKPIKENITLYAKYEIIEYKIYFYDQEDLLNIEPNTYTVNDIVELPELTKDNHMFFGWYDSPSDEFDSEELIRYIYKGSTGDKSFYAMFGKVVLPFNVTFKDGGEVLKTEQVQNKKDATPPTPPVKEGYNFVGWDKDYTNITEDLVINVVYEIINYSIKFYDESILLDLSPNTYSILDLVNLPTPTKDGFDFVGWYSDANLINKVNSIVKGSTGDKELYAKWEEDTFDIEMANVAFDVGDGVPVPSDIELEKGEKLTEPETPFKEGYKFLGWFLTGDTVEYDFNTPVNEDIILVAKWEKIEEEDLPEIVVPEGAFIIEIQFITVYGIKLGLNAPNASRVEYDWASSDESVVKISAYSTITPVSSGFAIISGTYKKDPSLKGYLLVKVEGSTVREAHPSEANQNNGYSIEFYDGSQLLDLYPKTYTEEDLVTFPTPTKVGYEFIGWYDSEDLVNRIVNLFPGTTGNQKFYAKWEKIDIGDEPEFVVPVGSFTFKVQFGTVYSCSMDSNAPTASRTEYDWTSSDESVAKISAYSTITPVSPGFAVITGTYKKDPSLKGYLLIKVEGTTVREADASEIGKKVYHTVTFIDDLDNVIETQEVVKGMNATLPTPPKKDGKLFFGWDKSHVNVQSDITIKASYILGNTSFEGKKVTIIGSSSSTYYGTMPEGYAYFYPYSVSGVGDVNQMWWAQIINKLGMELLINNSYSTTTVKSIGGKQTATETDTRLASSHVGDEKPDYIFISMGLNDCRSGVSLQDFIVAYNVMISKLKIAYPNAQIVLCTLTTGPYTTGYGDVDGYNLAIKQIAEANDFPLIDKEVAININNYEDLIIDSVHPNIEGMNRLANQGINDFLDYYGIKP